MIDVSTITLESARTLPNEVRDGAGVYFLWRGDELLYIGSSINDVMGRVAQQVRYKRYGWNTQDHWRRVPFDNYTILECERGEAREVELALLARFGRPAFNNGDMPGDPGSCS